MGSWYSGRTCRLVGVFVMTALFFLVELTVGYITNSMALVADSFHMLSDVLALIIAFLSVRVSRTQSAWKFSKNKNTFGWARAEVLGALVNCVFLLALCFSIFVEAIKRLYENEELHNPELILYVGVIGLIINIIGLLLLHKHGHGHSHGGGGSHGHSHGGAARRTSRQSTINTLVATDDNENDQRLGSPASISIMSGEGGAPAGEDRPRQPQNKKKSSVSMNMKGAFLHVLSDALGSVVVIISALIVWKSDFPYKTYVDPVLSMVLVLIITYTTWPLLKESALILLQTVTYPVPTHIQVTYPVPTHIQVEGIQQQLLGVDGVLAVHEFHVWQLAGDRIIASAHIRCRNLQDYMVLAEKVKKMFHEEGIHSTTIQPEFVELEVESVHSDENCILDCPSNDKDDCAANTCCGPTTRQVNKRRNILRQRAPPSSSASCVRDSSVLGAPGMANSYPAGVRAHTGPGDVASIVKCSSDSSEDCSGSFTGCNEVHKRQLALSIIHTNALTRPRNSDPSSNTYF
ncbi:Cation efflux protein [Trinorchestia longiramus]|nr:Cation efflux protein [Trinorchestia longiramus]